MVKGEEGYVNAKVAVAKLCPKAMIDAAFLHTDVSSSTKYDLLNAGRYR